MTGSSSQRQRLVVSAKRAWIDGRLVSGGVSVHIADGIIASVGPRAESKGPGSEQVDLGDRTLLPGLIDAHTHFLGIPTDRYDSLLWQRHDYRAIRAAGEARSLLLAGFTSVRCLGSPVSPALSRAIREGLAVGPRIVAAGDALCATNGTWDIVDADRRVADLQAMLVDGVDALRLAVRNRIRSGALVIKIGLSRGRATDRSHGWGDDPTRQEVAYSPAEIEAVVDEAHRGGVKVSAHCIGDGPVRAAVEGGIDVIEHGFGISDEVREVIAEAGVPVVTTFTGLMMSRHGAALRGADAEELATLDRHLDRMRSDFVAGRAAGVQYVLGSDLIGLPNQPQTAAIEEFVRAVEWGMSAAEAIEAGTSGGAAVLGLEGSVGRIAPGYEADLVACMGDPTTTIEELRGIDFVMTGGRVARAAS